MAKSSSLESLHNIVAHTIKRDVGGVKSEGVRDVRGGIRPAVIDHSISQPITSPVQSKPGAIYMHGSYMHA